MNAQEFSNLYNQQELDEKLIPFDNEIGFSLIRRYPAGTPYAKAGRLMFIKLAILKDDFFYEVNMTNPEDRGGQTTYIVTHGQEFKRKVTNFFSGKDEPFIFDTTTNKIAHQKKNKNFTVNEFIEILIANHLSDRLYFKRKVNMLVDWFLKVLFWLSGRHYNRIKVSVSQHHARSDNQPETDEIKDREPFFKYFDISKNLIFSMLLATFFFVLLLAIFPERIPIKQTRSYLFGEFSLSNPFVLLFFFLILFSCEKFSLWLNRKIKAFLEPEQHIFPEQKVSFIRKLHNFQTQNSFKLRLKSKL